MNCLASNVLVLSIFAGAAMAAVPLEKSGACAGLTRIPTPAGDDWGQFPVKPARTSTDSFPAGTIQDSLRPEQSINCIESTAGTKVQLWASERMTGNMRYIQHFSFDERGRLWAVEPISYPNTIRSASGNINDNKFQGGKDRIVILEDTDGDHVMDKFTVFKDGLNLPQSIECVNGGVVVTMTPYVVYFPNDGSDKAGTPVILFSGMGSSGTNWDTHGGINQIMYGLDNWMYGLTGYNGCTANPGNVDCSRGKVWRFRHTAIPGMKETKFEVWSDGPENADGLGQMEDGQIFQNGATLTSHINHSPVQDGPVLDIRTNHPTISGFQLNDFYPITGDRYLWEGSTDKTQGVYTSITTAVSGLQFYTSRLFPKKYWNRFAFTCEGASKLCNQDSLDFNRKGNVIGSSWKAYRQPTPLRANLFASRDAWVAPLLAKTGPDGAVWVLDWNNYLFLHNPAGPFGAGGAWQNTLRNKNTNRIYRVVPEGATLDKVLDLSKASEDELISTFSNQNFHWRLTAQRILIGKGYTAALGTKLKNILKTDKTMDAVGNCPPVQHALWTLEGLGRIGVDAELTTILGDLLKHPAWCVRRNALRVMPRTADGGKLINDACSVNDENGHVRLQAMLAFSQMSAKPADMKAIQINYSNVDATASSAFEESGLTTAASAPCSPELYPVLVFHSKPGKAPLQALQFQLMGGGFHLLPNGTLPSGTISVYDIQGRLVFTSKYDASRRAWSVGSATGMHQSLYGYAFMGLDGTTRQGSIALLGAR